MSTPVFYTRNLPHWQPSQETFFVTYRLYDSLPKTIIETLKEQYLEEKRHPNNQTIEKKELLRRDYFLAFEKELDQA